jgi:hypothetical protein
MGHPTQGAANAARDVVIALRSQLVMPGLIPASYSKEDVDGRDVGAKQSFVASPGHDGL